MTRCPHCDQELPAVVSGSELRQWRINAGLTLRELSERINVSHTFLCKIEREKVDIPVSMPRRYREALNL